jgi:hypothetical protein
MVVAKRRASTPVLNEFERRDIIHPVQAEIARAYLNLKHSFGLFAYYDGSTWLKILLHFV